MGTILRVAVRLLLSMALWNGVLQRSQNCPTPKTPGEEEIIEINRLIEEARSQDHNDNVPPELEWALIWKESQYDPSAENDEKTGVCTAAVGLGQLHEDTAKGLGLKPKDRFDPKKSIEAVTGYLSRLLRHHKDNEKLALAEYHLGSKKFGIAFPITRPHTDKDRKEMNHWKTDAGTYVTAVLRYRVFAAKVVVPYVKWASSSQANQKAIEEKADKIARLEQEIHRLEAEKSPARQTQVAELQQQLRSTRAQLQSARENQKAIEQKESEFRHQIEQQQQVIQKQQRAIEEKDAQILRLTNESERDAAEIAQLKKNFEAQPPREQDVEVMRQLNDSIAQRDTKIEALRAQLDAKDAYYQGQLDELKRGAESQFRDLQSLGERLKVIQPPELPSDVRLCMPGTLANPDEDLLNTGSLLLAYLENGEALDLPHVFSYSYRTASSYSRSDIEPMAGDYVGAAATGDKLSLTIGPNRLLTNFQTSLKSQTHRGRLTLIPQWLQDKPCRFERGLMSAYLPNEDYFAFLIVRVSSPRDVVGYVLTRANSSEQIVVVQFAAKWIGR